MSSRSNPLKLNKLQLRTLALLQILARAESAGAADPETGAVSLTRLPHVHGDHVHVGPFTVSARDASGFDNPAVWTALARKGLARRDAIATELTAEGLAYDTGLADRLTAPTDH